MKAKGKDLYVVTDDNGKFFVVYAENSKAAIDTAKREPDATFARGDTRYPCTLVWSPDWSTAPKTSPVEVRFLDHRQMYTVTFETGSRHPLIPGEFVTDSREVVVTYDPQSWINEKIQDLRIFLEKEPERGEDYDYVYESFSVRTGRSFIVWSESW